MKSSLFAKLMAMLDKHSEVSGKGKGKGLLLNGSKSGKGDPLAAAKAKQLMAMLANAKGKAQAEETASPLVSGNIIIDQALQNEKTVGAAILVSEQKTGILNGNAKQGLKIDSQIFGDKTGAAESRQVVFTTELQQSLKHSAKTSPVLNGQQFVQTVHGMVDMKAAEMTIEQKLVAAQLGENQRIIADPEIGRPSGEKATLQASRVAAAHQLQQGENASATAQANNLSDEKINVRHKAGNSPVATTAQIQQGNIVQNKAGVNALTTEQLNNLLAQADMQQKAEVSPVATANLLQKGKVARMGEKADVVAAAPLLQNKSMSTQPGQNATTTSTASIAAQLNFSNSSLADSGSQSSDRGSQDAYGLSVLAGDAKTATSASGTTFHTYLSQKAAPSMNVFDSMQHIAHAAKNGQSRLEIQLEPAGLGKIQIALQTDAAKQLHVHLIVDQSTTRQAIEQHLPALKNALAQQGLDLSGFSMGSHQESPSSGTNERQESNPFTNSSDSALADSAPASPVQQIASLGENRLSIHI